MPDVAEHENTETPVVHTEEPIAVVLCRATNMWPSNGADEAKFMDELLTKFDSFSEKQFNMVPEAARKWANDAIEMVAEDNPVPTCPGFEDVFEVEDHTPLFGQEDETEADDEEEDEEHTEEEHTEEEPAVQTKGRAITKAAKANGKAKAEKKVARGARATTPKAERKTSTRESRPLRTDGVTFQIMEEIFHNPKITVEDIITNLSKKNVEAQKQYTNVTRSFFRSAVKYLAQKGMLNKPLEF